MKVILGSDATVLVKTGLSVRPLNFCAEADVMDMDNAKEMAVSAIINLFICLCFLILSSLLQM
jgi:hypothetical protein